MSIPLPRQVDRPWLLEKMCELDLASRSGRSVVVTAAGYLLFAKSPQERITGASAAVRVDGRTENALSGNLWNQLESLIDLMDQLNRPFRLKGAVSEQVFPYPSLALKELIVNALVHRSYDRSEQLVIDIDESFLRITNPGGLVDAVYDRVGGNLQQHIEQGERGIKGYRNPVIADVFYGAGAMDKRGSGLPDAQSEIRRNGGQVTFGPVHDNGAFRAVVYRRPEIVDEKTKTAASSGLRTKYSANLLEVVSHPETVWTAVSNAKRVGDIVEQVPAKRELPFSWIHGQITTFSDLTDANNPLTRFVKSNSVQEHSWAAWESDKDRNRELVWLINECFYQMLYQRAMIVDRFKKRAYFPRTDKGSREITYRSSFRHPTRTVTKAVISKRTQKVIYWEHEAFWFGFESFANTWALRVLPGYVFTTDGERALLHHTRVGALATKKAAHDYNQQVFNDLVFWAWVFSGGRDGISIATGGPSALNISGHLASCELAMPVGAEENLPNDYVRWTEAELDEIEQEIAEETEDYEMSASEAEEDGH